MRKLNNTEFILLPIFLFITIGYFFYLDKYENPANNKEDPTHLPDYFLELKGEQMYLIDPISKDTIYKENINFANPSKLDTAILEDNL